MEVKGKTVVFLGDSITEGHGASVPEKTGYVSVFGLLSGAKVINYGISGTRIARQKKPSEKSKYDDDFNMRAERMPAGADLVVVFGGTNDFGHGDAPFGEFSDKTEYTFCGALHVLFNKLINKFPEAKIIVITPLHRLGENDSVNDAGVNCKPLCEYVAAIKRAAEYYSLPVLDLWAESGLQPNVEIIKEKFMPDGLHPSDAGARIIAEKLYNFTKKL